MSLNLICLCTYVNTSVSMWWLCTHVSFLVVLVVINSCGRHKLSALSPGLETFSGWLVSDDSNKKLWTYLHESVLHFRAKISRIFGCNNNNNKLFWLSFFDHFFSPCLYQSAPYQARFYFSMNNRYLLELFDLGVLEIPQGVCVFLLNVTQTCVTDLRAHFPDVCKCRS